MYEPQQFMASFILPEIITQEFIRLMPYQRLLMDQYMTEGKLINYALSIDHSKAWMTFVSKSEMEVLEWLANLPLTPFLKVDICLLASFETVSAEVPAFSLN